MTTTNSTIETYKGATIEYTGTRYVAYRRISDPTVAERKRPITSGRTVQDVRDSLDLDELLGR